MLQIPSVIAIMPKNRHFPIFPRIQPRRELSATEAEPPPVGKLANKHTIRCISYLYFESFFFVSFVITIFVKMCYIRTYICVICCCCFFRQVWSISQRWFCPQLLSASLIWTGTDHLARASLFLFFPTEENYPFRTLFPSLRDTCPAQLKK